MFLTQSFYCISRSVLESVTVFLVTVPATDSRQGTVNYFTDRDNARTFNWLIFHSQSQNQADLNKVGTVRTT